MRSNHTVRIKSAGRYASGLLITKKHVTDTFVPSVTSIAERATFILTADHFLRSCSKVIYVRGENFTATATTSLSVFGTDLGLIKLDGKAPTIPLPLFADKPLRVGMKTTTFGFGGLPSATVAKEIHGRVISAIPHGVSRNRITRVHHGALIFNSPEKAVKGDSGGPVLVNGRVAGIQSMISDPGGFNTGVATAASLIQHMPALAQALELLEHS